MSNKSKQIITPSAGLRLDRKHACERYIEQLEDISCDHVELNLTGLMIDYPITSLLTQHILEKLGRVSVKGQLTIITNLSLPQEHILNLLFRDADALTYLTKEELSERISATGLEVIVKNIDYDFKNEKVNAEIEICLP